MKKENRSAFDRSRLIVTIKRQFRLLCLYKFSYKFCIRERETRILIHRIGEKSSNSSSIIQLLFFFLLYYAKRQTGQNKFPIRNEQITDQSEQTNDAAAAEVEKKTNQHT